MIHKLWQELVTENPMLIEVHRFRRRFFSFGGSSALNGVVLGLAIVCYAGLLMLVFSSRGAIPPIGIIMFQTFLFTFIVPAMLYGSIAGERERRSWDLLVAAPITQPQIVVGKFLGGLTAVAIGYGLIAFAVLIAAVEYEGTNWTYLALAELNSLAYAVMLGGMTLFFSARSRRGFMALGTVLAALAVVMLVLPIVSTVILDQKEFFQLVNSFHPFLSQAALMEGSERYAAESSAFIEPTPWATAQIAGYLMLTILFLMWASKTLTFAENDIKFIPAKPHA